MAKPRTLSGIQPSGELHLGNYLGAIKNWVAEQEHYENFFCIVDQHAITVPQDPKLLRERTRSLFALYLACGLSLEHCVLFVQSHVPAHTELAWLFNTITPMNWAERMIQYKEKKEKQGEETSVGLFSYPILQAADILLYQPKYVPVGEDQRQHIELCRDIARRFNDRFGEVFLIPEALIRPEGARVMSLTDGTRKMSKSDPSDFSRIHLLDDPDTIRKKIQKCKTDPIRGIAFDDPARPEAHNLLTIYMLTSGKSKEVVAAECAEMGWGQFKPLLADSIIAALQPIQQRYRELWSNPDHLLVLIRENAAKARAIAEQTLKTVREAMGLLPP
ncbi:tryptophan--tRNA ligase [Synechococcus sp. W55.2]|uniref:tryptophan--tRNA ligase n=1 Tax=Synechococcus sp. W55.2 TaxID=2964513 RepID=UPI0039C08A05